MKSLRNETSETTKASGGALEQSYKPRGQFIQAQDGARCIAAICACPKFARTGAWGSRSTEEIRAVPRTKSLILACRSAFALYFRPSPLGLAGERFVEPAKRSLPLLAITKQLRKRNEKGGECCGKPLGDCPYSQEDLLSVRQNDQRMDTIITLGLRHDVALFVLGLDARR